MANVVPFRVRSNLTNNKQFYLEFSSAPPMCLSSKLQHPPRRLLRHRRLRMLRIDGALPHFVCNPPKFGLSNLFCFFLSTLSHDCTILLSFGGKPWALVSSWSASTLTLHSSYYTSSLETQRRIWRKKKINLPSRSEFPFSYQDGTNYGENSR